MVMEALVVVAGVALLLLGGRGAPPRALTAAERSRVALLVPSARRALERLRAAVARRTGVQLYVGQTWHSQEVSDKGFEEGRSATRQDWHQTGRAVDVRVVVGGKQDLRVEHPDLYEAMGAVARELGWRWLGLGMITNPETGASFSDPYHLEWREGASYAQALRAYERRRLA